MKQKIECPKEIIIKPTAKWKVINVTELWRYKELVFIFAWRDIKVRYKNTFLGVSWVMLQPLIATIIFTFFFGKVAKIYSGNLPYQLFVLVGLVYWTLFSSSITQASNSFIENTGILKKIYFPKEILVFSILLVGLVDFGINFMLLMIFTFYYGFVPNPLIFLIIPIAILIIYTYVFGLGILLASFNVKYRDVRYILPFFIQLLLFLTPVIYPLSAIRNSLKYFLALNPLTGPIESMRVVLSGSANIDYVILIISFFSGILFLIVGLIYFRSNEQFFADIL